MDWEQRLAAVWAARDEVGEAELRASVVELVEELPPDDPVGAFELGSAYDGTPVLDLKPVLGGVEER